MSFSENLPGGRYIDERSGLIFPWYTKPFLTEILTFEISSWKVFEYGCGDSTLWWRRNSKIVISVDNNKEWAEKMGANFVTDKDEYIRFPIKYIEDSLFDCIIIDGEPMSWRDQCTMFAISSLKPGGILIIDNYNQKSVDNEFMTLSEELLRGKVKKVFQQENHKDWKTAYWVM